MAATSFWAALWKMAKDTQMTVDTFMRGTTFACKDVTELMGIEDEVRGSSLTLRTILEMAKTFGGEEVFEHCKSKLGIGHKQTTADGVFSLEEVECIGACSWAPAAQVNYDFHENLTAAKIDVVLDRYRKDL